MTSNQKSIGSNPVITETKSTLLREGRVEDATIRAKLFHEFGVMGSINDRGIICNNVEICVANVC